MTIWFLLQDTGRIYGAERATLDLMDGLKGCGKATPACILIGEQRLGDSAPDLREAIEQAGIRLESIPVSSRFSFALIRGIRTAVSSSTAPVLHCVGPKAILHGGLAAGWGRRFPVVATIHGWLERRDWKEAFYAFLERRALKRFTRVVVLSSFYEKRLRAMGVRRDRLLRIPSGLKPADFPDEPATRALVEQPAPFTLGLPARFSEEKNHGLLIDAVASVRAQGIDVRAILAGEGPCLQDMKARVHELGLEAFVTFPGYLDRTALLASVHAVAMTSRIENLPYALLEAMAWRRPVIATRVGGISDVVADTQTGFLVEAGDAEGLAAAIQNLAGDVERARSMGDAGRERVENEFSQGPCIARHAAMYEEITKSRRR